jgi:hypothetical protein
VCAAQPGQKDVYARTEIIGTDFPLWCRKCLREQPNDTPFMIHGMFATRRYSHLPALVSLKSNPCYQAGPRPPRFLLFGAALDIKIKYLASIPRPGKQLKSWHSGSSRHPNVQCLAPVQTSKHSLMDFMYFKCKTKCPC